MSATQATRQMSHIPSLPEQQGEAMLGPCAPSDRSLGPVLISKTSKHIKAGTQEDLLCAPIPTCTPVSCHQSSQSLGLS